MANDNGKMDPDTDDVNKKIKSLEVEELQAVKMVGELEEKTKQIQKNSEKAIEQVTLFASQLMSAINQSKKKLLQDIDDLKNKLLNKVKKAKTTQQLRVKDIQRTRDQLNKLLQTLSGTEEVMHDLLHKDDHVFQNKNKYLDPSIRFYPSEEALDLRTLDIGKVYIIEEVDSSRSFFSVSQSEFEALSPVHVTLQTNTTDNRPCIVPYRCLEVDVWPTKYVNNLTVEENKAGILTITFVPKVSGKFIINAKVEGRNVLNSPYPITIEPQKLAIIREIELLGAPGLKCPCGIAVTRNFTKIAVSDAESHCVAIFCSNGELLKTIGQPGTKQGRLSCPDGIAFVNECEVAVADRDNHRVQVFDTKTGKFVCSVGKKTRVNKAFKSPWGVFTSDNNGDIIVSDTYNHRVQIFHRKTKRLVKEYSFRQRDGDSTLPSRTVCYKNLLLVADALNNDIHIIDQSDGPISTIETKGGRESVIKSLNGIAMGKDGNIAVCDQDDGSVKLFNLQGHFIGKTQAKLSPVDIATLPDGSFLVIDGKSEKLLVIDVNAH